MPINAFCTAPDAAKKRSNERSGTWRWARHTEQKALFTSQVRVTAISGGGVIPHPGGVSLGKIEDYAASELDLSLFLLFHS